MTKVQAIMAFREYLVSSGLDESNDKIAKREAWAAFTDSLCKSGDITEKQYNTWTCLFGL